MSKIINVKFEEYKKGKYDIYISGEKYYPQNPDKLNDVVYKIAIKYINDRFGHEWGSSRGYEALKYRGYIYQLDTDTSINDLINEGGYKAVSQYLQDEINKIKRWMQETDKKMNKFSVSIKV